MNRVVIYARTASEPATGCSIEDQIRQCREMAESRDWSVQSVFTDRATSGMARSRPGFDRMLRDAFEHQFDRIIAVSRDRLSRDIGQLAEICASIPVAIVREGDTSNQVDCATPTPTLRFTVKKRRTL